MLLGSTRGGVDKTLVLWTSATGSHLGGDCVEERLRRLRDILPGAYPVCKMNYRVPPNLGLVFTLQKSEDLFFFFPAAGP